MKESKRASSFAELNPGFPNGGRGFLLTLSFLIFVPRVEKIRNLSLVFLSGILLSLAWPSVGGLSFLLFIAFIPLLYLEEKYYRSGERNGLAFFGYAYLGFFTWNAITTWWIYYSTLFGMIGAVVFNSFFMTVIFYLFHLTRKKLGSKQGYIALVVYWIAWEWFHMQWDLSWPWLTLGNGFADYFKWIQWYEYTGVFGGSLWVLAGNILIFKILTGITLMGYERSGNKSGAYLKQKTAGRAIVVLLLILVPVFISHRIYNNYEEPENPVNVVVVQPNIDPYNVKFDVSPEELLEKMFLQAEESIDSSTSYLVFPETALTENIWENGIDSSYSILFIKDFIKKYPRLKIVTGASTYYAFSPQDNLSPTARKFRRQEGYYDAYNTALQIDSAGKIRVYHKSKLVVGVEKMPYPALFKPLESFAIDLGGTSGSLGMQERRDCFFPYPGQDQPGADAVKRGAIVAPVICYESIYGEYVTDYIKNGADVIFILTNDGWWDNTAGHRQHLAYGRLRAIETRRSIARSANTGISCFINQRGDISQPTGWWEEAVISQPVNKNTEITFYTRYGDYIARSAIFISIFLLLWTIVISLSRKELSFK